jgi:hypothetical protein
MPNFMESNLAPKAQPSLSELYSKFGYQPPVVNEQKKILNFEWNERQMLLISAAVDRAMDYFLSSSATF